MRFDPEVWGSHYWFVIHSIALSYPEYPNQIIKKKYYQFFQDLPLFIPEKESSQTLNKLIEQYPVEPYLDCRTSMFKWTHFIHNQVNAKLGKPKLSYYDALERYYDSYKPKVQRENREKREKLLWVGAILSLVSLGVWMGHRG
jgi:hypothetical protein